ncbi:ABC transporter permease [Pollutimonas bauzanensis]|uniref:Putative spermidine/putrescine transport system permease protein n=1 Tax=Pollutimonas bauzanensis TaxID=658167 RepID=A0A1M6AHP6_9BURK|nr:ABC transporter permease [Pollutimonas bauzanensis]SHI36030.1 putative spermidine/putrescine transport system permease protein [Pollutimonas bauzanensis]
MFVRNGPIGLAFHALFVAFILAPLIMVCAVAFTSEGFISLPTNGLSLRWFQAILDNPRFIHAFMFSLGLGLISATLAMLFAIPSSLAIARFRFPGRDALMAFFLSPLMIPHVVLGLAFLRFFTSIGVAGTYFGLVVAHIIVVMPYALRLVLASATGLDPSLERAALSLGASPWTTFRRIVLPLIMPGVVSGWVIAFITSFDELTMSIFIASPSTTTLPVRIFLQIEDTIDPLVTAVSAALIYLTIIAIFILDRTVGLEKLFVGKGNT